MKKIKFIITSSIVLSMFLVGVTVYGSTADDIAQEYGYPTVTSLLNAEGVDFTPEWEQNVKGYNSNDGATYIYNSTHFATPATANELASCFGGEVIPQSSYTGGVFTIPVGAAIKVDDTYINAGSAAEKLRRETITYNREVENYKLNLENNPAIFISGNISIPTPPMDRLRSAYGISGGSCSTNGSTSGTTRTSGDCIGRGCPSTTSTTGGSTTGGTNVINSSTFQSNTATATYVRALTQLVNQLIIEARFKLGLPQSTTIRAGDCIGRGCPSGSSGTSPTGNNTVTTNTLNQTQTTINTSGFERCTGKIYTDITAAKACAALAESQGNALGYNTSCEAAIVNSLAGNYINMLCTVNGNSGQSAYQLAGWDSGGDGVSVNSHWKIYATQYENR